MSEQYTINNGVVTFNVSELSEEEALHFAYRLKLKLTQKRKVQLKDEVEQLEERANQLKSLVDRREKQLKELKQSEIQLSRHKNLHKSQKLKANKKAKDAETLKFDLDCHLKVLDEINPKFSQEVQKTVWQLKKGIPLFSKKHHFEELRNLVK